MEFANGERNPWNNDHAALPPRRAGGWESIAPLGRAKQKRPSPTGSASRCAGTRHPWLQPLTPSGSTAPHDKTQSEQAPNIGGFLQSTAAMVPNKKAGTSIQRARSNRLRLLGDQDVLQHFLEQSLAQPARFICTWMSL